MTETLQKYKKVDKIIPHKFEISWYFVFFLTFIHLTAAYGLYLHLRKPVGDWREFCFNVYLIIINLFCMFGIVAGTHRLWSHQTYKAKWPVRLFLAVFQTAAIQEDIYEWSLKHRLHHKFSDTEADPTNVSRGFWWAHIGWLFFKPHPAVVEKLPTIDMSDVLADPIVRFQRKFYTPLVILIRGSLFTGIPWLFTNYSLTYLFCVNIMFYVLLLHYTWLINSIAHMHGYRPHDKTIQPADNPILIYLVIGGGYHNYHHIFPYDYQSSEYGWEQSFNPTTFFIDFCAKIGWVSDRKRVPDIVIQNRKIRTGDLEKILRRPPQLIDYLCGLIILFWPMILFYSIRIMRTIIFSTII